MKRRFLSILLAALLVLTLLPTAALADNLGGYELDLSSGQKTLTGDTLSAVGRGLTAAAQADRISIKLISSTEVAYDLDKDGANDISITMSEEKIGKQTVNVGLFRVLATASVGGRVDVMVPSRTSVSGDYYGLIRLTLPELAVPEQEILTAAITVVEPVAGEKQSLDVELPADAGYTVINKFWRYGGGTVLGAEEPFVAGTKYTIYVEIEAKEGYKFTSSLAATVNGVTANSFQTSSNKYGITMDYTPTAELSATAVTVTAPKAEEAPDFIPQVPADSHCKVDDMYWSSGDDTTTPVPLGATDSFQDGGTYFIMVKLAADEGYTFADSWTATLNGEPASQVEVGADWTTAVLYYVFPKLVTEGQNLGELTIDLSAGPATFTGPEAKALVLTLEEMAAAHEMKRDTAEDGAFVIDLGEDGTWDLRMEIDDPVAMEPVTFELLETNSVAEGSLLPTGTVLAQLAAAGNDYYDTIYVTFPLPVMTEVEHDTLDLSHGPQSRDDADFDALRGTLSAAGFGHVVKRRTDGDTVYYDLDSDGAEDIKLETVGGTTTASLLETSSLQADFTYTIDDSGITYLQTSGSATSYAKTVVVKIPEPVSPIVNPFEDIDESHWAFNDVMYAYSLGLVNGKDLPTTYKPNDKLLYSEAIKLAACMHQLYTDGAVTLTNGSPRWYDSYIEYALANGIIGAADEFPWDETATRAGYIQLFSKALPDSALAAINTIPDGSIPDVDMSHPNAEAVYKLYRAGIIQGQDPETHACLPDSNIMRSEVAAILTRMMDSSARKTFSMS